MFKKNSKRVSVYLVVAAIVASFGIQLLAPFTQGQARALTKDDPITWETAEHFYAGGKLYTYTANDGGLRIYTSPEGGCTDRYLVNTSGTVSFSKATASSTSANTSCGYDSWGSSHFVTNQQNTNNKYVVYYWENSNTIKRLNTGLDGTVITAMSYTRDPSNTNIFLEDVGTNGCKDQFVIEDSTHIGYRARSDKREKQVIGWTADGKKIQEDANEAEAGCYITKQVGLIVGFGTRSTADPKTTPQVPGSGAGGAGSTLPNGSTPTAYTATDNCYNNLDVVGWILCPIVDLADGLFNAARSAIYQLLFVPVGDYQNDQDLNATWSVVKNIATTGVVLVALVMVASQIFSFEFMSAYTVKKVLPRIVIAAIAIQLSWFIFGLLIQLSNAIGIGLYAMLTSAFRSGDIIDLMSQNLSGGGQATAQVSVLALGGAAVATGLWALGPGAWITIVLTLIGVMVSLLVALFTLIVRKILIIVLLVLSPIALLLWILPGTQNLWQTWWKLFSRLLMMFPLIAILFAAGTIGASVILNIGDETNGMNLIAGIVAYFAPLFLVTATFKFAGSVFGAITGGMNKLGNKVSGSGFGLRARQDAYKKLKNEQRAMAINESSRRNMAKALDPNARMFRRLQGRSALGPAGYIPGIAGKRLNKAQQQYGALTDKLDMDDAKLEWGGATKSLGHTGLMDAETAVIDTDIGQKATFAGADGKTRSILVTPHVKRLALASAASSKNDAPLLRAAVAAGQPEELSPGVPNPNYKPAEVAAYNNFLGQDGGFGAVDSIAADASRGTPNDIVSATAMPAGLKNFGTQRTSTHKDAAGNVVVDLDRQQAMIDQIHALSLGGAFAGTYGHDADASKQKATAAAAISAFAARDDLKDIAPADIAKWSSIPIEIHGGGGAVTNAAEVINGNYRVTIDPGTGNMVAVPN